MKDVERWLGARTPAPPMSLRRWVPRSERSEGAHALVDRLCSLGVEALVAAETRPGRVRESAFELLAADALFTYACEAALEEEGTGGDEPEAALLRVLRSTYAR